MIGDIKNVAANGHAQPATKQPGAKIGPELERHRGLDGHETMNELTEDFPPGTIIQAVHLNNEHFDNNEYCMCSEKRRRTTYRPRSFTASLRGT